MNALPRPALASARAVALLAALGAQTAAAQQLDAQRFQPAVDGRTFTVLDDATIYRDGIGGGMTFNYADDPFIYRFNDPDRTEMAVLGSVATTNLLVFANMAPFRVGLDLPLHLASEGYGVEGFRLIGDMALDGKYTLLDRSRDLMGLGFTARVGLPTGNGDAWLGDHSPSFEGQINAAYGRTIVGALNLGLRGYAGEAAKIDDVTWGSRFLFQGGVSVPVLDPVWVTAELSGERLFGSKGAAGATPIETLLSLRGNPTGDLVASLGLGAGLTRGIGAPDYRVVAGVAWVPGPKTATDAAISTARASGSDRDNDGIIDIQDLCPDQAEDINGKEDYDGCPDGGLTPTRLRVVDPQGAQVAGAVLELTAGPENGKYTTTDGEWVRSLPPGSYTVNVSAAGYTSDRATLKVPDAPRHEATFHLSPIVPTGEVTLTVLDPEGAPVAAKARLLGLDREIDVQGDGVGHDEIPAGSYEVVVSAPGYSVARRTMKVEPGGTASLDVVLSPARVQVTEDRIVILDKVFFEFDSAVIKPESFAILDEVVAAMKDHPELIQIEVQGHTDDQGPDGYNLKLSQARAEAVMLYLVRSGVASDRLLARGYGEERPLQPGETADARATNRRVEFVIQRRGGEKASHP